ncbi:uncharacterized protein BCR38DRAFT_501278 [Pseudomassariella vexata]|uniref:Carrier domain-containing protein n=1 Tax=Pseudomassariella vexata TaxID=1141098 RepID=A0A1Y2DEX8_9PEZI|nr:uncharacterized protein BCR38DRAFT_501278 [Pseudomassariella vexata]ORY57747.1 hypothetical protein BCR38DRAFT_501278 [Pseudomassariella vexata]
MQHLRHAGPEKGAMLVLGECSTAEFNKAVSLLQQRPGDTVEIACYNAASTLVVIGTSPVIGNLEDLLRSESSFQRVRIAFHQAREKVVSGYASEDGGFTNCACSGGNPLQNTFPTSSTSPSTVTDGASSPVSSMSVPEQESTGQLEALQDLIFEFAGGTKSDMEHDKIFTDLGLNSLASVEFIGELSSKFNLNIASEDLLQNSRFISYCQLAPLH